MYNDELLKIALKENSVIDFFRGTNGYRIMGPNGVEANALMQDYSEVVNIFHRVNGKIPDYKLPVIMHDNILELLKSDDAVDIYTAMNILNAELFKEKFPTASFKLDEMDKILTSLRNQLEKNKKKLSETVLMGEPASVWELYQRSSRLSKGM